MNRPMVIRPGIAVIVTEAGSPPARIVSEPLPSTSTVSETIEKYADPPLIVPLPVIRVFDCGVYQLPTISMLPPPVIVCWLPEVLEPL